MDRKINFRKILLEQTSGWERLPDNEQSSPNELKYERLGCELKKFGTKWFKKCSAPPSTGLDKYVGEYEGQGFLPSFSIKVKDGKLYGSLMGGETELTNISDNKFNGKVSGIDFEITFELRGESVVGGQVNGTVYGVSKTAKFKRKSSNTNTSSTQTTSTKPPSPWDCIIKFNKELNQFDLIDEGDYRYEQVEGAVNGQETIFMYYKDGNAVWAYLKDKKPILKGKWECKGDKGYLIKWSDGQVSRYGTKENNLGGQTDVNTNTTTNALENPCVNGYKEGCVTENDILGKKKALKVCSRCDLIKTVQENPEIKARIFRIQKELGQEQKTDNTFGPVMLAAIKEFQQSHGINPTGNVGEKTLSKINPGYAKRFYLDRGGKKFESGDKTGGAADYAKALQIQDGRDEREGVLYWMMAEGTKDKKAKCSAYIKSIERGYWNSAYSYKEQKCPEISGLPPYEEVIKKFGNENDDWTPKDKNEPVINKTEVKPTNKPEVKPIYRRSSRQVLSPDDEL